MAAADNLQLNPQPRTTQLDFGPTDSGSGSGVEGGPIDKATVVEKYGPRSQIAPGAKPAALRKSRAAPRTGGFLELVAQLSSRFVNVPSTEVDGEIEASLERIVAFFDLDRCVLFKVDPSRSRAQVLHQISPAHEARLPPQWKLDGPFPWLYAAVIDRGETLSITSLGELPRAAGRDAESLRRSGARSTLLIPLPTPGQVEFVLAFASNREERHWTAAHIAQLRLLGEVFVGAIERKLLEDAQHDALRFEHVIADVLSGFARVDLDQLDQQIQATLEELLAFAQVDQFGIFTVDQDTGWVHLTHAARPKAYRPYPPRTIFPRAPLGSTSASCAGWKPSRSLGWTSFRRQLQPIEN